MTSLPPEGVIECMFVNVTTKLHIRKTSQIPPIVLLQCTARQMAIGLYIVTHVCFDSHTYTMFFLSTSLSPTDLDLALSFVTNPKGSDLTATERFNLQRIGVITIDNRYAPYPPSAPTTRNDPTGMDPRKMRFDSEDKKEPDPAALSAIKSLFNSEGLKYLDETDSLATSWRDAMAGTDPMELWRNPVIIRCLGITDRVKGLNLCLSAWKGFMHPIVSWSNSSMTVVVMECITTATKIDTFQPLIEERRREKTGHRGPKIVMRKDGTIDFEKPGLETEERPAKRKRANDSIEPSQDGSTSVESLNAQILLIRS